MSHLTDIRKYLEAEIMSSLGTGCMNYISAGQVPPEYQWVYNMDAIIGCHYFRDIVIVEHIEKYGSKRMKNILYHLDIDELIEHLNNRTINTKKYDDKAYDPNFISIISIPGRC